MRKIFGILIAASLVFTSCTKDIKPIEDTGSINGPTVSSNIWQSGTYINDATVFSTFNSTNKATIFFGDDNVYNWTLAPRGSTPAPANWELEQRTVINAVNRGVPGATFANSINLIDSLKRYRYISGAVYVMLGTNDLYTYGTGLSNIWSTTMFGTHFKAFMDKLMLNFNGQNIFVVKIPSNSYATPWVGSGGITQVNDSILTWCNTKYPRVKFVSANPPYMQPSAKYISYNSLANGYSTQYNIDMRAPFVMGNIHTGQPPVIIAYGATGFKCRSAVSFGVTASSSHDPDGHIVSYLWTSSTSYFSISNPNAANITVTRNPTWPPAGIHTLTLKITDNEGNSTSKTYSILLVNCP